MFTFNDFGIEADVVTLGLIGVCIFLVVMLIVVLAKTSKLRKRYESFMDGQDGKSLEVSFQKKFANMDEITEHLKKVDGRLDGIDENLLRTYQKVGVVKYDAFKEIGGTLSFVLVMLSKEDNGFILNSMHSNSEGCYTYIKEVKNGEVFVALSEEERQALEDAKAY